MFKLYIVAILYIFLCYSPSGISQDKKIVGYINSKPLYQSEFLRFVKLERAGFHQKNINKVTDQTDLPFLSRLLNGKTMEHHLKEMALKSAIKNNIELQILAKSNLLETSDHFEIIQNLKSVNRDRIEKSKLGEVIYGPVKYDLNTYMSLYKSNAINKFRDDNAHLWLTQKEIENYYESHKFVEFSKPKHLTLIWFESSENKKLAPDEVKILFSQKEQSLKEQPKTYTFGEYSPKLDETKFPELFRAVNKLNPTEGQIFQVITKRYNSKLVKVKKAFPNLVYPIDEVKHVITRALFEKKYDKILVDKAKSANVQIFNQKIASIDLNKD